MRERMVTAVLGIICLILAAIAGLTFLLEDKEGPKIIFNSKDIVYREGEDTELLLKDVKARDKKDGDVSDTLTIEDILMTDGEDKAKVIYAAADKNGHVVKSTRTVTYEPMEEETADVQPEPPDKDEDDEDDTDGEDDNQPTEPGAPVVKLSQKKVEIEKGGSFRPLDYVKEAKDDKDDVWKRLRVSGEYDVNKEGTYEIRISATDTDGNRSNEAVLMLVVR